MAATTISSGDFILDVGKIGQSLMTSFTKFITYRKVQDRRLENLYATLSLTTTTLFELGQTLNKYDFKLKDEAFKPICETAKSNLERFLVLINEGISSGVWKNDGNLGGQAFTAEADPWLLITVSLGGREQAKRFWGSLDDTRDSLIELKDIVQYMVLKTLSQKTALNQEQSLEFKNLATLLPHIVHSMEKAEKAKKEDAELEKERLAAMNMYTPTIPPFQRREADEASDITLFVDKEPRGRRADVGKGFRARDCSVESFRSYESSVTDVRENPNVIYEEWTLRWNEPLKNPNSSVKFLGLKLTRYYEDAGFWGTDAEFRTQQEMKEQHQLALGNLSPAKHQELIKKAVQAIPKKGGLAIDQLLENRIQVSNHEISKAVWEIVSIKPREKHLYSCAKKWGKDPMTTDWAIILRGEKIDTTGVAREQPHRRGDPWAKDPWMRGSRDIYRSPPRWTYEPERSFSPRVRRGREPVVIHHDQRAISPPRRGATMEAIPDDGFRPGTVVIGRIPSKEEAEKKIEEIWAGMTGSAESIPADE